MERQIREAEVHGIGSVSRKGMFAGCETGVIVAMHASPFPERDMCLPLWSWANGIGSVSKAGAA